MLKSPQERAVANPNAVTKKFKMYTFKKYENGK